MNISFYIKTLRRLTAGHHTYGEDSKKLAAEAKETEPRYKLLPTMGLNRIFS